MISQLVGVVESLNENTLMLSVAGITYEVYIPTAVLKGLDGAMEKGAALTLVTYHYHQTDPSKSIPILIGFANRIEREFFERFITVSGVGPKAAVRALSRPIPEIAQAIDGANLPFLKSLPGIGEQRAKEIIAKLQGKMGKFGLMRSPSGEDAEPSRTPDVSEEALEVLHQLQYRADEAREMIRQALKRRPELSSAEEILNEVYRQKRSDG